MNHRLFFYVFLTVITGLTACSTGSSKKKQITERIQYDVTIKSPDPEWDWWVQNLEGSKREGFVKAILNAAYSGKVKTYDYFNKPLTVEEVKAIGNRTDTVFTTNPNPPYQDSTMVVKQELDLNKINRVRFLEEWYMDENKLIFEKKVLGIAPVIEVHNDDGSLRGWMPLFWIYLDKEYPAKFSAK